MVHAKGSTRFSLQVSRSDAIIAQPAAPRSRARLDQLDVSLAAFADLYHVHPNTVSNWVRGRARGAAELVLTLEDHSEIRRALRVGATGASRGRLFVKGNVHRFGDRRRRVAVAGAQMARAAA